MRLIYLIGFPILWSGAVLTRKLGGKYDEIASLLPIACPLKLLSGFDCPSCGLTRSLLSALCFDFNESIKYHAFGPVLAIVLVGAWIYLLIKKDFKFDQIRNELQFLTKRPALLWSLASLYLLNYLLKMA